MNKKRILIATGGTGGHIYPAVALAQKFAEDAKILFVGGGLAKNRYFDQSSYDFRTVDCSSFTNQSPFSVLNAFANISKGIWQSRKIIKKFNPDVAIGFGSYYAFPPLVAAKLLSIPIILHEANSIPGKVNRFLAPMVLMTGVHFPSTLKLLKGKKCLVGMPLRRDLQIGSIDSKEAYNYFNLSENCKTILVFGGSQGADVINHHALSAFKKVKEFSSFQVIHLTGKQEVVKNLQNEYDNLNLHACVKAFENQMGMAWKIADCAISRAGASSIAEQLEFEVPGILIPFAKAADDHQNHNADFLSQSVGGAKKIQENELTSCLLSGMIVGFLDNNGRELEKMKKAMNHYKQVVYKQDLFSLVNQMIF